MSGQSAQDKKANDGQTSDDQEAQSSPKGSILGIEGERVSGKPVLVRTVKDKSGATRTFDVWNDVIKGMDVKKLEQALAKAKVDPEYDMTSFIRSIEYQGFDRDFYIKHALSLMSVSVFCRFAIIGAIRGSKFEKIAETCEEMPQDLKSAYTTCKFLSGTPKKRKDLTLLRNTACIPHWCCYWMLKAGVTKKVADSACPSALQFPGAASLPMSRTVRIQHLDFSLKFSKLLPGGSFNMNIYMTAYGNPIPVSDIPQEVASILGVSSNSESHILTEDEVKAYSQTLTKVN